MDKFKTVLTLGIMSLSSTLAAQEHNGPFEKIDSDGNGSVSFAEFQENGINMLTLIDTDQNGVLTLDEFLNARPGPGSRAGKRGENPNPEQGDEERRADRRANMAERAATAFQEMDLDGDEILSVAEFQEANFLRLDRDSNGVLTAEELRPPRGPRGKGRRGNRTPPA